MAYNQSDMLFEIGDNVGVLQVLFGMPNRFTGGAWINIFLMTLFAVPFIYMIANTRDFRLALLSGSSLSWLTSFGLFVVPQAGVTQNHLLITTVLLASAVVLNYFSQRR